MSSVSNIAITGLNDAVTRIANAASNIVNASSTSPLPQNADNYSGFVPQDVVTVSVASSSGQGLGVTDTTTPQNPAYVAAYNPSSAQANAQGLVATPNVDLATQLVNAKIAQVNYAANATILKIEQKKDKALLDITT